MSILPDDICKLIEQSFKDTIENFEITVHSGNKKGEGYIGEIIFVSLEHKIRGTKDDLVIKKVSSSNNEITKKFLSSTYLNEINYYTQLWPALKEFEKSHPEATHLNTVPKCYGTCSIIGEEKVILENLKFKNYEVHPKITPLSAQLYEKIFKVYGHYHALSFAFKHYQPEEYLKLTKIFQNNWLLFKDTRLCNFGTKDSFNAIQKILEEMQEHNILKNMQPYIEDGVNILGKSCQYNGPYSILIHGDCWSNNLMIKYNESKQVKDIKLIDYQMCMIGSPVYDLTYTFYSGAAPETLKDWEHFVKIYYQSLSKHLHEYNLNVDQIYPYEALVTEWKEQSKFAFIMSILIWGAKCTPEDEVRDLDITVEKEKDLSVSLRNFYVTAVVGLIKHFHENNLL